MTTHLPLIIDLDGTLLLTDTLVEGLTSAAFNRPTQTVFAVARLYEGRPALKKRINALVDLDFETLPVRQNLLNYLESEKARGRPVYLVTAADQSIADAIAARFGVFDEVHGTNSDTNLKGSAKQAFLRSKFPDGYVYAGDSSADLKVWCDADGIILAGASKKTREKAARLAAPIEAEFSDTTSETKSWLKALRVHQWAKNLLLFVPLLLSGQFLDPVSIMYATAAFLLVGLTASGTYILNDLVDLSSDRRHRTKNQRPWASGALFIGYGLITAPVLILMGLIGAVLLSPAFAISLAAYLVITLSYSFRLKRVVMLDVFILATLFTLRLAMGTTAISAEISQWLLTFSMFFFFSLSLAKRHVEVDAATPGKLITGRGYLAEDAPLTLNIGLASAAASIVILVLYLAEEAFPSGQYAHPEWLWFAPIVISLWMMRIWLLAHRGQLDDDPVAFAVKDKWSMALGGVLGVAFMAAVFI